MFPVHFREDVGLLRAVVEVSMAPGANADAHASCNEKISRSGTGGASANGVATQLFRIFNVSDFNLLVANDMLSSDFLSTLCSQSSKPIGKEWP